MSGGCECGSPPCWGRYVVVVDHDDVDLQVQYVAYTLSLIHSCFSILHRLITYDDVSDSFCCYEDL